MTKPFLQYITENIWKSSIESPCYGIGDLSKGRASKPDIDNLILVQHLALNNLI